MPSRSKTPAKRRGKKSSGEATAVTTAATLHSALAAGRASFAAILLSSVHFELRMLNSSGTIGRPSRATVTRQHRFRLFGTTTWAKRRPRHPQKLPPSLRSGVSHNYGVGIGRLQLPCQCGSALHHDRGNILARTCCSEFFCRAIARANSVVPLAAAHHCFFCSSHVLRQLPGW